MSSVSAYPPQSGMPLINYREPTTSWPTKRKYQRMKLSTRARYALRMMVDIARHTENSDAIISLNDVSGHTRITRRYLEQLAIALKNGGLIRGKSGKGGGYTLSKAACEITAREIIQASIGPINIVECVMEPETCLLSEGCNCRPLYCLINERIIKTLDELSLEDLVKNRAAELSETVTPHP